MVNYLSKQEAKEIDKKLYSLSFSTEQLVEMAGQAAFEVIQNIIQTKQQTILVVIGPGNNGADGLVIARWLSYVGHKVSILMHKTDNTKLLDICINLNIKIEIEIPNIVCDYVIDALFGISGYLPVKKTYMSFIEFFKNHPRIISIDVPSSYDVDESNENPIFVPIGVICLFGPKKCCQNVKTYVTRSFAPKSVFCDESYTNYVTFTEL